MVNLVPPKSQPVREFFRLTKDYAETLYLQPRCGRIPLGEDLEKHSFDCSLYWLRDRIHCLIIVSMVDGKTVDEARSMAMIKTVTVSFDPTVTTTEVWAFARLGIMVAVGMPFEVQASQTTADGSKYYPISHWVDDMGNASCPNCKMAIIRQANRQPFPVGVVVRCRTCGFLILNRNQELKVRAPTTG